MKEKKPVGPHKLLKICRRLFFSGALTMLTLAFENIAVAAAAFGVDEPSGIGFAGAAPVCGTYSPASAATVAATYGKAGSMYDPSDREHLEHMLGADFFAGLDAADPKLLTVE